jgi:hypothetical protein
LLPGGSASWSSSGAPGLTIAVSDIGTVHREATT